MKSTLYLTALFCCFNLTLYAQCDTGSEPECTCETAEVLCSVGELDGFSSSMSEFQHPSDGPDNFCPPGGLFANNPTWFAFIAWCEDIEMEVSYENCTTVGAFTGAQIAVYTDCTFEEQIDCDSQCEDDSTVSLDLSDLTIGESYYVMLDGCNGSACDYEISVSPSDCDEFIEEWEDPVTEDEVICVGNIINYTVDNLSGATSWHWYLDGELLEITDGPSYEIAWDAEGEYELCVDVSNICLDESEEPEINCSTITVGNPDAGTLDANDSPDCPEEIMDITLADYNMDPIYNEILIFTDELGEVILTLDGTPEYEFTWPTCQTIKIYSLNYVAIEDVYVPDVGDDYAGNDCTLLCCDEICITVVFEDEEPPEFDRPPEDVTVDCYLLLEELDLDELEELDVEDNCKEDTSVLGIETIQADTCNGGTIIREWSYMDACGNEAYHKQTITILPLSEPSFVNPPSDTMMSSLGYQSYGNPQLIVDNGKIGECKISGVVDPVVDDNRNGCAGFVNLNYAFIDSCGRNFMISQRIDIIPDVMVRDTSVNFCDIDQTGDITLNQVDIDALVSNDLTGVTVQYYPTSVDLNVGTNQLVFPLNLMSLPETNIYAFVLDASGCSSELIISITLSQLPDLVLAVEPESCFGDEDGIITVTSPMDLTDYLLVQNNDTISNNIISNLMPGNYNFILTDTLGCTVEENIEVETGFGLSFRDILITCNNNGTGTDETDDFYTIEFRVEGGINQYSLDVGSDINQGVYEYDEIVTITVPADGNFIRLTSTGLDLGCIVFLDLNPLVPCSSDCALSENQYDYQCNNNGTPLDPNDDFYEFDINISAINGSTSNTYNVYVNDVLSSTFNYDEVGTFVLPADGLTSDLRFEDADQNICFINESTIPLIPCSNLCQLDITIVSINCVDPLTPADNDDDLYEAEIIVNGINSSTSYSLNVSGDIYNYGETILLEDNLIINGDLFVEAIDSEDNLCTSNITLTAPAPCSSPCELEVLELTLLECNDNMTGFDEDDFFNIELNIGSLLGTGLNYALADDNGEQFGPFDYGTLNEIGPFIANGNDITLTLSDPSNSSCFVDVTISQEACSSCDHTLVINADNLVLDCENTNSNLDAVGDEMITNYIWEGPGGFNSDLEIISISESGEYSLTATFADGCTVTEIITIDVSEDTPISNAGEDLVLNCLNSVVTLNSDLSQIGNNVIINWLDETGNIISEMPQFDVTEPGLYGLLLIDTSNQCMSEIDQVLVEEFLTEPSPEIIANPGDFLNCTVTSIILSYESEDDTEYSWLANGQTNQASELIITEPQSIMLTATNILSGCTTNTSIEILDLFAYPQIILEGVEAIDCISGQTCVTATSPSYADLGYNWYDSNGVLLSNDPMVFCFDLSGQYSVELVDLENGCVNSEEFNIVDPLMPTINLPSSVTLVNDEQEELIPIFNIDASTISDILWETEGTLSCYNCLTTTIIEATDGMLINVTITTEEGCTATTEVRVSVKRIPKIYIPNVFTPSDGINFTMYSNTDIDQIDALYIYDRWGNLIFNNLAFNPNDPDQGWNGTKDNKDVVQGVYVYLFQYVVNGQVENNYGTITLIR
ncbi:MAG: hypothetical protein HKN51_10770 [Saprospiraceae bacterium]|nr:hypothetical protein [Saprospiraceae bacterium]